MKTMTQEEKVKYMKIALGICNFSIDERGMDLVISLYELTMKHKGGTKLDQVITELLEVEKRNDIRKKQKLLDEFSEKKE